MTIREQIDNAIVTDNKSHHAQRALQIEIASGNLTGEEVIAKLHPAQVEALAELARNYKTLGREATIDATMQIIYPLPVAETATMGATSYRMAGLTLVAMVQRNS